MSPGVIHALSVGLTLALLLVGYHVVQRLIDGLHHWQTQLIVLRGGREVLVVDIRA